MMEESEIFKEVISLTESLVSKSNMDLDVRILVSPGENPGETFLIITVLDTVMFKVPMRNDTGFTYGAGSGIHMKGLNVYDPYIAIDLQNKYNTYANIISTKLPIAVDNELRNNEEFEKLLSLKSAQGLKYYHLPDYDHPGESYMIPMFAGFLSLNKADTIGVQLYDFDEINHLIRFNIYKKKLSRNIEMYCRVLKI